MGNVGGDVLCYQTEDTVFLLSVRCLWATCVYTLSQQRSNLTRKWLCLSTVALLCHLLISGSKTVRSFRRTLTCWEPFSRTRLEKYNNTNGRWIDVTHAMASYYGSLSSVLWQFMGDLWCGKMPRALSLPPCQLWFQLCWYQCANKLKNETWFCSHE